MTTAQVGIRSGNVIVPYMAATKRTKELALVKTTDITFATTGASLGTYAIPRASVIFYADSTGNWRMRFNISLICSSGSRGDITVTFTGLVFKNVSDFKQAVCVTTDSNTAVFGWAAPNASTINIYHATSTTDEYNLSGDVELNAEPTTYTTAANMEGVVAVDVYLPPASATEDGLVNRSAQNFSGVKTYNDGIKLDDAAEQSTLNYYKEDDTTLSDVAWKPAGSGSGIGTSFGVKITRVGRFVTLHFPENTSADPAGTTTVVDLKTSGDGVVLLPIWARPIAERNFIIAMRNVSRTVGIIYASTDGTVAISTVSGAAFDNGTNVCGIFGTSITYIGMPI